ncbi:MAG TPA: hypothetical protein VE569_04010 [Acidimicrobiia bacterium]|jgi:heme-degrading monooxygenase HmoA|nr:hypothetical protein [Acidimicrobiia bacterium]
MIIQIVRYGSRLSRGEVDARFKERSDRYRSVAGLLQKYYVEYEDSGEFGGIYVWDSKDSMDAWRAGNLAGSLAETYQVVDEPRSDLADVMLVLHPDRLPN